MFLMPRADRSWRTTFTFNKRRKLRASSLFYSGLLWITPDWSGLLRITPDRSAEDRGQKSDVRSQRTVHLFYLDLP